MLSRLLNIEREVEDGSIFLFGARQTGKSTLLREQCPNAIYYDLLDNSVLRRFVARPSLLYETLIDKAPGTLVIIDEVPEAPELLSEVHRLISERSLRFVLCGSSARKLKRKGHNTLGGRALPVYLFPLVSAEVPDFDIDRAVNYGMLPPHYLSSAPVRKLASYVGVYLKEEVLQESLVRNLNSFQRFLEVAAMTNGEILNYNNVAQECGVSASSVRSYFDILEDTLIGYRIPAFSRVMKRRLVHAPKFWYFDVGVANHLLRQHDLCRGTVAYGHAFEHLVIQEIYAYLHYTHSDEQLSYWRTHAGHEVDAVIGDARVAIEIKSADEVQPRHLKGLKSFAMDYPGCRLILVSLDPFNRRMGDVECINVTDFLKTLWSQGL